MNCQFTDLDWSWPKKKKICAYSLYHWALCNAQGKWQKFETNFLSQLSWNKVICSDSSTGGSVDNQSLCYRCTCTALYIEDICSSSLFVKAECCDTHCCPEGFSCDGDQCSKEEGNVFVAGVSKTEAVIVESVMCPDRRSECPDGSTCCILATGRYGCCPLRNVRNIWPLQGFRPEILCL